MVAHSRCDAAHHPFSHLRYQVRTPFWTGPKASKSLIAKWNIWINIRISGYVFHLIDPDWLTERYKRRRLLLGRCCQESALWWVARKSIPHHSNSRHGSPHMTLGGARQLAGELRECWSCDSSQTGLEQHTETHRESVLVYSHGNLKFFWDFCIILYIIKLLNIHPSWKVVKTTIILLHFISAVKWLIAINRIQNKSFCLRNICVCTVYIYVYINTHTYSIYFENIYMHLRVYIYIHINYIIYEYI